MLHILKLICYVLKSSKSRKLLNLSLKENPIRTGKICYSVKVLIVRKWLKVELVVQPGEGNEMKLGNGGGGPLQPE